MKNVIAWLAGLAAMILTVFIVEFTGHLIWPPPETLDLSQPDAARLVIEQLPVGAKLIVLAAWALGAMFGGFVSTVLAASYRRSLALSLGVLMIGLVGINLFLIPHPLWMTVTALLLPVPMAWLGHRLAMRHEKPVEEGA